MPGKKKTLTKNSYVLTLVGHKKLSQAIVPGCGSQKVEGLSDLELGRRTGINRATIAKIRNLVLFPQC